MKTLNNLKLRIMVRAFRIRLNNGDLLELVKKYVYVGMPVVILTSEADSAGPCRLPAAAKTGPRPTVQPK